METTITLEFAGVKLKIPEKDLTFEGIERMVLEVSMALGRQVLEKAMVEIETKTRESRERGKLENRGKQEKYLDTLLGAIRYERTRYWDKETGQWRYLVEEKLGLEKNQRVSLEQQKVEIELASEGSYRGSERAIEAVSGIRRSHEAIRQSVLREGARIIEHQEYEFEKIKRLEIEERPERAAQDSGIGYFETDATYVRLQKRRGMKKKKKKSLEVKVGIGYRGKEKRYEHGKSTAQILKDKHTYVSTEGRNRFMEKFSLRAESRLSYSQMKHIFFGADGDEWIQTGVEMYFPGAVYLLCLYHLYRNIRRCLSRYKEEQRQIKRLVDTRQIPQALHELKAIAQRAETEKDKKQIEELHGYLKNNQEGIHALDRVTDEVVRAQISRTGAIEGNIDKTVVHRFKRRGMSWSKRGATRLLKIKELLVNEEWDEWWYKKRNKPLKRLSGYKAPLSASRLCSHEWYREPMVEMRLPALNGTDRNKPWAKVLRELVTVN